MASTAFNQHLKGYRSDIVFVQVVLFPRLCIGRIYVDVVLNHMTGSSSSKAVGVGGSGADTINFNYPAVPYTKDDFHTPRCGISDYDNPVEVRKLIFTFVLATLTVCQHLASG